MPYRIRTDCKYINGVWACYRILEIVNGKYCVPCMKLGIMRLLQPYVAKFMCLEGCMHEII